MFTNKKIYFLLTCFVIVIFILIFWEKIEHGFYFIAYKEKCLITIQNDEKIKSLKKADQICRCIVNKLKVNNKK